MRKLLLFFALALTSQLASAAIMWYPDRSNTGYPDAITACQAVLPSGWTYTSTLVQAPQGTAYCMGKQGGVGGTYNTLTSVGGCYAPSTQDQNTGGCIAPAPACPAAGTVAGQFDVTTGYTASATGTLTTQTLLNASKTVASGGCTLNLTPAPGDNCFVNVAPTALGYRHHCELTYTYSGAAAPTGSAALPPAAVAAAPVAADVKSGCPDGSAQIGTDSTGTPICKGTTPVTPAVTSGTSSNASSTAVNGGTTVTNTTVTNNVDNSVTTTITSTTTNPDGSVTTAKTSSTKDTTGNPVEPPKPENDFCKLHPELTACRNSSVVGACAQTNCEGDAIQCAILREEQKTACDFAQGSPQKTLGDSILAGTDSVGSPDPKNPTVIDLSNSITQLDASPFLGGGACIPDQPISVYGKSFAIPWSKTCDGLAGLRVAVMFLAYLSAYKLLARTVIEGV